MHTLQFAPLNIYLNACVHTMVKAVWPQGFDVGPDAPQTLEELKAEYSRRGKITVYDGGSDRTIFDCPDTNRMFRAWHDWAHLQGNFAFDIAGEHQAALLQCEQVKQRYGDGEVYEELRELIMAEIVGQAHYAERHEGRFPVDQMAFTRTYLKHGPNTAIMGTF